MVFCLMAWGTQFLTSCAESDHMDEYEFSKSSQPSDKPTSDEVTQKLEEVPGVSDVTIQYSEKNPDVYGYYFRECRQILRNFITD